MKKPWLLRIQVPLHTKPFLTLLWQFGQWVGKTWAWEVQRNKIIIQALRHAVFLAPWSLRLEDLKLRGSLGWKVRPCLKNQNRKKKKSKFSFLTFKTAFFQVVAYPCHHNTQEDQSSRPALATVRPLPKTGMAQRARLSTAVKLWVPSSAAVALCPERACVK